MAELLGAASMGCGRPLKADEIPNAIDNSERALRAAPNKTEPRRPKWPTANGERIEAIGSAGPGLSELEAMSPVKWSDDKPHTEEIIDSLFPGNPLLCVGQSEYAFNTMPRERWRGRLAAREFIVPSPMISVYGVTKAGKTSKHTLSNTGKRRFLVVEFDSGTFDQHAALLSHLRQFCPFVLAVHSGNKSLHGWFYIEGQGEQRLLRFMRYAVSLGADKATWTKSQFVRLPDGLRNKNRKRQTVVFFNPSVLSK
jgi:hypothetical protein